jgi:excisionase family DNA binding protein
MSTTYPDILTPDQAADYLQVNRETIYRYIRDGRLSASRIGRSYRIRKQSLELLLAATSTRPDIQLRTYTDQQLDEFLVQDQLDAEASAVVRKWKNIEASSGANESC